MKNKNEKTELTQSNYDDRPHLIPVTKWNDHHAWPPIGGLRHLIFNEKKNGFDACVIRVGGRVLIDEGAFFNWVKNGQQHAC